MLKSKDEFAKRIEHLAIKNIANRNAIAKNINILLKKRNIPIAISSDILTLRTSVDTYSNFIGYCVLETLCPADVPIFFTEKEIAYFVDKKYEENKMEFPITISDMIQIADDQWLGKFSVKDLIKLRDAQLINYNENTQRIMETIVRGEVEIRRISLNKKQVRDIEESYKEMKYIPNTITLNMPEDTDYDYNNKTKELIVKSISAFDIIDGYHRYIAISNLHNINKDFDYPMEIRICYFPENKAKQFIWQEDQKTQMKKVLSETYNQSSYGNQICTMLGMLYDNAIRVNGIIDATYLAQYINLVFYYKTKADRPALIRDKNTIKTTLEELVESNPELLNHTWSKEQLLAFTLVSHGECEIDRFDEISNKIVVRNQNLNISMINAARKLL